MPIRSALCHVPRFSLTLPAGDNYVVSGRLYGGLHLERFEILGRICKENKIEQFHSIYKEKVRKKS